MYKANQRTVEMASFGIEGNVIDHSWYQIIKLLNGKTDSNAIIILSDLVYWYRPIYRKDEVTGKQKIYKKFQADILQRSYTEMEKMFGFTKEQSRKAMETLERLGIAERETRTVEIGGVLVSNILFIKLNHEKLLLLMKDHYEEAAELKKSISSSVITDKGIGYNRQASRLKASNTETTTETSSKNDDGMKPSVSNLKIKFLDGTEQTFSKQDLFSLAVISKSNWSVSDIEYLYLKLSSYKSGVSDLKKLCDKIIANKSVADRAEKYSGKEKPKAKEERYVPEREKMKPTAPKKMKTWTEFEEEKKRKDLDV